MKMKHWLDTWIDSPDDDTLKLVFADWLEEQDDARHFAVRRLVQMTNSAKQITTQLALQYDQLYETETYDPNPSVGLLLLDRPALFFYIWPALCMKYQRTDGDCQFASLLNDFEKTFVTRILLTGLGLYRRARLVQWSNKVEVNRKALHLAPSLPRPVRQFASVYSALLSPQREISNLSDIVGSVRARSADWQPANQRVRGWCGLLALRLNDWPAADLPPSQR